MLIDDPSMIGAVLECPHCNSTLFLDPADFDLPSSSVFDSPVPSPKSPNLPSTSPSLPSPPSALSSLFSCSTNSPQIEHALENTIPADAYLASNAASKNGIDSHDEKSDTNEIVDNRTEKALPLPPLPPPIKRASERITEGEAESIPLPPPVRSVKEQSSQVIDKKELNTIDYLSIGRSDSSKEENHSAEWEAKSTVTAVESTIILPARKWTLIVVTSCCVLLTGILIAFFVHTLSQQPSRKNSEIAKSGEIGDFGNNENRSKIETNKENIENSISQKASDSPETSTETSEVTEATSSPVPSEMVSSETVGIATTTVDTSETSETVELTETSPKRDDVPAVPADLDHSDDSTTNVSVPAMLDVEAAKQNAQPLDFTVPARPVLETPEGTAPQTAVWPPPEWGKTTTAKPETIPESTTTSGLELSSEHEQLLGIIRGTTDTRDTSAVNTQNSQNKSDGENTATSTASDSVSDTAQATDTTSVTDTTVKPIGSADPKKSDTTIAANRGNGTAEPVDNLSQLSVDERLKQEIAGADFRQTTLADALFVVSRLSTVPIVLDWNAVDLEDIATLRQNSQFASNRPVELKLVKTTYLDILKEITQKFGLTWNVENGRFVRIARSESNVSDQTVEKVYPLSEFLVKQEDTEKQQELFNLVEMVRLVATTRPVEHNHSDDVIDVATGSVDAELDNAITPSVMVDESSTPSTLESSGKDATPHERDETESSDNNSEDAQDGSVSIQIDEANLSITMLAPMETHQRVQYFLQLLAESRNVFPDKRLSESIDKTKERLTDSLTWMMYEERPLQEVLQSLAKISKLTIVADWIELDRVGVTPETPVELRGEQVSLSELLTMMGDTLPIDFHLVGAGVVEITSREGVTRSLEIAAYDMSKFQGDETEWNAIPERLQTAIPRLERYPIFMDSVSKRLFAVCPKNEMEQIRQQLLQMLN